MLGRAMGRIMGCARQPSTTRFGWGGEGGCQKLGSHLMLTTNKFAHFNVLCEMRICLQKTTYEIDSMNLDL